MRATSRQFVRRGQRRGSVLPLVVVTLTGMVAVSALAVDVGLVTLARTQAQAAADSAALTGVRSLNGSRAPGARPGDPITTADNNYALAGPKATEAATRFTVLGTRLGTGDVTVSVGKYYYDSSLSKFRSFPVEPGTTNDSRFNWSLVSATVNQSRTAHFASFLGNTPYTVRARAIAVHRPRDVALVLDFSGSMRFGSLLSLPHSGVRTRRNNPDPLIPKFGAYSATSTADLRQSDSYEIISGDTFDACNVTAGHALNDTRPAIVNDFFQDSSSPPTLAFTSAGAGDDEGLVSGDPGAKTSRNTGTSYAKTVSEIFTSGTDLTAFDPGRTGHNCGDLTNHNNCGYDLNISGSGNSLFKGAGSFKGYTQGPAYWGKTFFLWPPDPRGARNTATASQHDNGARDWRQRFFLMPDGVTPVTDNTKLWELSGSGGDWFSPNNGSTFYYKVNYRAILHWIMNTGPNPFPPELRAGRILYYDAFPNPADTTLNTRFWNFNPGAPSGISDDERFWKDYIDYVLGLSQTGRDVWDRESSGVPNVLRLVGLGEDYTWGTLRISSKPSGQSIDYADNPKRPRSRFWFGPMTMVDFMGNYNLASRQSDHRYNWMPGNAHEAPMYACKLGIQGALADIESNHPNDSVSLVFYSRPKSSSSDKVNRFNSTRVPLGRLYQRMKDSLFFPPATLDSYTPSAAPRPYHPNIVEDPHPSGSTCYAMGLMLAYNQFSGNPSLVTYSTSGLQGEVGGLGRRGAYKLVILQTDGLPNTTATASFVKVTGPGGANHSYYRVRYNPANVSSSEYPSVGSYNDNDPTVTSQIYDIANRICALDTASTPGYATPRKPVKIHCIGYGPVFDAESTDRTAALATLQQIERIGKTQSASTPAGYMPDYKIVTGADEVVINKLRTAISQIMQDGVQVSLIE